MPERKHNEDVARVNHVDRADASAPVNPKSRANHRPAVKGQTSAVGAGAIGAQAIGTLGLATIAVGAIAIGAVAIGALSIGRLMIGRARIRRLEIDELVVRRLRVMEQLNSPPNHDSKRLP